MVHHQNESFETDTREDTTETGLSVGRLLSRSKLSEGTQEGMTLVEIMIVVVIMALIATGVGVAVIPKFLEAKEETTKTRARTIRNAVILWIPDHPEGGCPSVQDLVDTKNLDSVGDAADGWGRDFQITCDGGDVLVTSAGEDGEFGTEDDIS